MGMETLESPRNQTHVDRNKHANSLLPGGCLYGGDIPWQPRRCLCPRTMAARRYSAKDCGGEQPFGDSVLCSGKGLFSFALVYTRDGGGSVRARDAGACVRVVLRAWAWGSKRALSYPKRLADRHPPGRRH